MQFGPAARAVCAVLLVIATVSLVMFSLRSCGTEGGALKAFLGFAVLLCVAATVEVFGVAHRLVPGGIERVAPGRARLVLRWGDVVHFEWSPSTRWYELRTRAGERARVYAQLSGIASFARAALEGVPAEVVDATPGLRSQLEAQARGVEPPGAVERDEWQGR